jgi:murein DD-endopeptidase MepM/ murein hydrolase activator NlpD
MKTRKDTGLGDPLTPSRPRIPRRRTIGIMILILAVLGTAALLWFSGHKRRPAEPIAPPIPAAPAAPALAVTEQIIRKGQTISDLLGQRGFSNEEIHRLKEQVKPVFNLNRIIAGRRIRFRSEPGSFVRSVEYEIDDEAYLVIDREGTDFRAEKKNIPYETRVAYIDGAIEDNPINAFDVQGEKAELAIAMTDLFVWDIDFYSELRKGDSFRMVYEKKILDGAFVRHGAILAAEFICQGKKYEAFRFEYPDTHKADFFDREGKSCRKEFLRSPLPFARITSRFSFSRLHPIHKVYRAHFGVDYGAPLGYPVHATADGTVTFAGTNGASGRMVTIRHKNSYETLYLHLQQINVKKGDVVSSGQVIGAVGSSGESTGPHLDYRVKQGGSYVNPLSWKFQPVAPLRPEFKDGYKEEVRKYDLLLNTPRILRSVVSRS